MFRSAINRAVTTFYKVQRLARPCRFVFVVGHMRSGSSLLTRILSNNPRIAGYGESFLRYNSTRDLDQIARLVSVANRRILLQPYIMDKVVHSDALCEVVFRDENCRFIFLAREPESSMQSHFRNMVQNNKYPEMGPEDRQSYVHDYYDARVRVLLQEALMINDLRRRAFLTYDDLINRTPDVFQMLEDFLGLDAPLSESYSTTKDYGIGDESLFITTGRIDRTIRHEPVPIAPWFLEKTNELYERFTAQMRVLCRSLPLGPSKDSEPVLSS
jgi:hypothetical protein